MMFDVRVIRAGVLLFVALASTAAAASRPAPASPAAPSPEVVANDNRHGAGTRAAGMLTLRLRAAAGLWLPEGPEGPALSIEALGEEGAPLMAPAPLIRVPEGTAIAVTVHNELATPLRVHGLCARDGGVCVPLLVPPGATGEVQFASGRAGTYHYWASAIGAPIPFREMAGAFVVDPPSGTPAPDRVLVITEWSSLAPKDLMAVVTADVPGEAFVALQPAVAFMVNGLSWPATERLTARVGEPVRWRVVNLSSQPHPMHLHGFYFDVDSQGDGMRDLPTAPGQPRHVVTQLMRPGGTLAMTWTPERDGNWLFHCHLMEHVSPMRRLPRPAAPAAADVPATEGGGHAHGADPYGAHDPHGAHDASLGMSGLVLGVTVTGSTASPAPESVTSPARRLILTMRSDASRDGGPPVSGFVMREHGTAPASGAVSVPGPPLVLRRGEPVEITLENTLSEATAIHWHGMELDSFYDGVHGFSGSGLRQTPIVPPGGTFVVRFTPPRAGTFIYHTHLHDHRQLSSGLYGPLIVTEPGESIDPAVDHTLVLGRRGVLSGRLALPDESTPVVLNGARAPRMKWAAGTRHRVRLINITPDDIFEVSLRGVPGGAEWTPVAKDAEPVPAEGRTLRPAVQAIAVGETYDFEVETPPGRKTWWLEVRSMGGKWELQSQIVVR